MQLWSSTARGPSLGLCSCQQIHYKASDELLGANQLIYLNLSAKIQVNSPAEISCIILLLILQNSILAEVHAPIAQVLVHTVLPNVVKNSQSKGIRSPPPSSLLLHTQHFPHTKHEDPPLSLLCLLIIISRVSTMQS